MDFMRLAAENEQYTIEKRRYLHERPELTGKEYNTLAFIRSELDRMGISYQEVKYGGIIGWIRGKKAGDSGKTLLLRADMDALPVEEDENNLNRQREVVSKTPGVSHMCGHDGHTAMLLTSAKLLQEHRDELDGNVILMFERGEEGGENCYFLLKYLLEEQIRVDGCWSMHMAPAVDAGKIAVLDDGVMAGLCAFDVTIKGKGGHGSRPDLANNPVDCYSAIATALQSVPMREISPFQVLTYTICLLNASPKINVIPEQVRFGGTARFYEKALVGEPFKRAFLRICDHIAAAYDCTLEYNQFLGPLNALKNHPQCTAMARKFLGQLLGPEQVVTSEPLMGSESMAEVHLYYPGVYCLLGTKNEALGCGADMHHPQFDLDESVLKIGVAATLAYTFGFLSEEEPLQFAPYDGDLRGLYSEAVDQILKEEA